MKKLSRVLMADQPLFVGLGNIFRHDDGLGVYFCQELQAIGGYHVLVVELSLENYLSTINQSDAEVVVMVDAVSFNREPGYCKLLPVEKLISQTSHTHNIALPDIGRWIEKPVKVLGIQPGDVSFGEGLTQEIIRTVENLISTITDQPTYHFRPTSG